MIRNATSSIALALLAAWIVPAAAQDAAERDAATARDTETNRDAATPRNSAAAEEYIDRTPVKCIQHNRMRETEIIDDRTILFYLRGGRVYRNFLEDDCPGLERSGRYLTQTRTSRLCDSDLITVLDSFGSRFERGFTCRLGEFHPITAAEAELMELEPDEAAAAGRSVEITPVELPDEEEEGETRETGDAEPNETEADDDR